MQQRRITEVTGVEPHGCPWRAWSDPVVQDVAEAYAWDERGQLAMWWGADPPNHLVEGLHVFRRAQLRATNRFMREQLDKRKREAKSRGH